MISLPQVAESDITTRADWVEVCALVDPAGGVSQAAVADVLGDMGASRGAREQTDFAQAGLDTEEAEIAGVTAEVWRYLRRRSQLLKERYPFVISRDRIEARESALRSPCYSALLLMSAILHYDESIIVKRTGGTSFRTLFERVVESSQRFHFRGACMRFGWPPDKGGKTAMRDRVMELAAQFNIVPEDLAGKIEADAKDATLDVLARLSFVDDGPGTLLILTQCATGKAWREKRAEPVLTAWADILQWQAQLVRALAVPWMFDDDREYARQWRHFDSAIVFDRLRLISGRPDDLLQGECRGQLQSWCTQQLAKMPRLRAGGAARVRTGERRHKSGEPRRLRDARAVAARKGR